MPKLQLYSRNLRGQNVLQDRPQIGGEEKLVKLFFPKMIQKMVSASKGSTLVGNGAATYGLQTLQMAR